MMAYTDSGNQYLYKLIAKPMPSDAIELRNHILDQLSSRIDDAESKDLAEFLDSARFHDASFPSMGQNVSYLQLCT